MARRLLQLTLVFLTFTVEIRVKAASEQWRHEPLNCDAFSESCAWLAKHPKSQWQHEGIELSADRGSIIWWQGNETTLAKGRVLLQNADSVRVNTIYGAVVGSGDFILDAGDKRALVTALRGEVRLFPRGRTDKEGLLLPEGFQVSFGMILNSGQPDIDIPLVAPVKSTIVKWWDLYPGIKADFMKVAADFVKSAPDRADIAGVWQKQLVDREIAAAAERERKARLLHQQEIVEKAKMKALFRKMNYLSGEMPD